MNSLDKIKNLIITKQYDKAIAMAAKWPRLGLYKETIQRAASANLSPDLYRQLGQDPEIIRRQAIQALHDLYLK